MDSIKHKEHREHRKKKAGNVRVCRTWLALISFINAFQLFL